MKNPYSQCLLLALLLAHCSFGQTPRPAITLSRDVLHSSVGAVDNEVADHALRIASYILSSTAFQDSVGKRLYDYHNLCVGCMTNKEVDQPPLSGKRILDSLFHRSSAALTLTVQKFGKKPRKGKCFGLGWTCPQTDSITSYYLNIQCDMGKELPFVYAYAVHLCHEYAHNVGYCHTYNDDDVAEAVGWIAYHYTKKWYDSGTRIP